ncbi:hypothetical protein CRYPA_1769 [uncultured Candidatus Thioglobus sp.]|nr:hypothetical protein CRYPA_1769 [uncultured Candidatus Thioglobus sp.]
MSVGAYEKLIDGIRDRYCQPKESLDFGVSETVEVVEEKPKLTKNY